MGLTEAVADALADEPETGLARRSAPDAHQTRTRGGDPGRAGSTNRGIAAQLYLSVRTVDKHVDDVQTKLGFSTRDAAGGVGLRIRASAERDEGPR